jgi:hypothetical protein
VRVRRRAILFISIVVVVVLGGAVAYAVSRSDDSAVRCPVGYGYTYGPNVRGQCTALSLAGSDVVHGIPLRTLARLARAKAAGWSELHPVNMRVAVGSDRAANALMGRDGMTYKFGDTTRAYVVALDGHFACNPPKCVGSVFPGAPPTTAVVSLSTLLLTFDPTALTEVGSLRVVTHDVDLSRLGKVYSLDHYTP